jgi:hypothetical protein
VAREAHKHVAIDRLVICAIVASLLTVGQLVDQATAAGPPSASTGPALSLTSSSANVTGTLNPNGQETTYAFQYGTTTGYGFQTNPQSAGAGTQDQVVVGTLTGLAAGTTYHYRLIATNASATTVGADMSFTTRGSPPPPPPSPPPTATTSTAISIGQTTATVRGRINPKGASTTYYFEYGLTAAYGNRTPSNSLAAGNRTRSVSASLSGLQAGGTYHYRVVATNANGTTLGNDQTFTTSAPSAARALPTLTSRVRPRWDHARPFRFRVRGRLLPPAGVDRSQACRGRVTIRFKRRRKTVKRRRARITTTCRYRRRVRVRLRPRPHSVRLRVRVRFRGNAVLRPKSARTKKVRAG